MTTQPITTNPLEAESRAHHAAIAESRARFAEHVAAASAPQPAAPQREANPDAAAAAKAMQAATNPDGSRKHTPTEIHAAWTKAFTTPVSAGTTGSTDPRVHPASGIVAKSGHHFERVTFGTGRQGVVEVPDGQKYDVYDTPDGPRSRFVPDAAAYRGPEIKTAEPDAFGSQSAARDRALGDRTAQHDALNALAATRINGERLYDRPADRARVEEMRAKLFAGEDISQWLTEANAALVEANFTKEVKASGYVVRAPEIEGYDVQLDSALVAKYAETARAAGLTQEQFQKLVDRHIQEMQ